VQWESAEDLHPSRGATGHLTLSKLEVCEQPNRVASWLDTTADHSVGDFEVEWVDGQPPGLIAASFATPEGVIRIP
jgi:hypothetical protein